MINPAFLHILIWLYLASLLLLALILTGLQVAGYWRWQNTVAVMGWPSVLAILFTLIVPLLLLAAFV